MKGRRISLDGLPTPHAAMQRIISVRFAEVLSQAAALKNEDPKALHNLRIACKRLRYSIELFADALPKLRPAAQRFTQLQDELGEVHDCDVLLEKTDAAKALHLRKRIARDRSHHVLRAKALWVDAFCARGPFAELIAYTGFGTPA